MRLSKSIFFFFISLLTIQSTLGQFYIRHNNLGYSPNADKTLIILSNENLEGQEWKLNDNSSNLTVLKNNLAPSLNGIGLHTPFLYNYRVDISEVKTIGDYTFQLKDSSASFKIDTNLYSFIPSDILRYFRVQRSGSKDALDHKISHKGDKRAIIHRRVGDKNSEWKFTDALPKKMDMRGGWYDAGDYIKFTLTTAYGSYLMLKSYELNPNLFQTKKYSKTELNDLLDEASWGLDFLLKTYQDSTEFIIQVAGHRDHQQGDRLPEYDELNGQRECYSAFSPTQMGYTAAALALGATIFKEVDSLRAKAYEQSAIKIFSRARNLKDCHWVKQGWETFYADKTPYDNLLLAAIELHKLTNRDYYLRDIDNFKELSKQGYWSSWANSNVLANSQIPNESRYAKLDLDFFNDISKETGNIWQVPHKYTWGSLYSFLGVGNSSLLYNLNTESKDYDKQIWNVLDYTLGKNNWGTSFVASKNIPNSAHNIYTQIYKLQPKLYPTGAIAEGPGDRATHEQLKQYFAIPKDHPSEKLNSSGAVFYDLNTNFQTMETTIVGLAEGLLFFSLIDKFEKN